jgi:crotonobetainyl-CoA:carnitine CoA-transferase CaiB-like acyl-CoA transferase
MGAVLAHPQAAARKMIQEVASPVGAVPVIASPLNLSASEPRLEPLPSLGQHTEAILQELGYTAQQIGQLRAQGVI